MVLFKIKPECFLKGSLDPGEEGEGSSWPLKRQRSSTGRELLSYLGRRCTELEVKSIAEVLKVDPTCVSRSVARAEARIEEDKKLKKSLDEMAKDLENVSGLTPI